MVYTRQVKHSIIKTQVAALEDTSCPEAEEVLKHGASSASMMAAAASSSPTSVLRMALSGGLTIDPPISPPRVRSRAAPSLALGPSSRAVSSGGLRVVTSEVASGLQADASLARSDEFDRIMDSAVATAFHLPSEASVGLDDEEAMALLPGRVSRNLQQICSLKAEAPQASPQKEKSRCGLIPVKVNGILICGYSPILKAMTLPFRLTELMEAALENRGGGAGKAEGAAKKPAYSTSHLSGESLAGHALASIAKAEKVLAKVQQNVPGSSNLDTESRPVSRDFRFGILNGNLSPAGECRRETKHGMRNIIFMIPFSFIDGICNLCLPSLSCAP